MKRLACWTFLPVLFLLWAALPARADVTKVAAIVGDDVITSLEVDKVYNVLLAQVEAEVAEHPENANNRPSKEQLRHMALERLIEDKIFDQEVKRANIVVTPPEIDMYIQRIKAMNQMSDSEFAAQLSRRGMTPEDYREDLKRDLLKHKLVERAVKSRVVISDKEVEDFYRAQQGEGPAPAQAVPQTQVRLRALFLNLPEKATPVEEETIRRQAEDLRKKADSGDNFPDLARRFSQGPGAQQGGELGPVDLSDLLPEMRQAVSKLKPGQISQVIKVQGSYVFMQLLQEDKTTASSTPNLSREERERIRAKLEHDALDKRFREWLNDLRSKVYIKIME